MSEDERERAACACMNRAAQLSDPRASVRNGSRLQREKGIGIWRHPVEVRTVWATRTPVDLRHPNDTSGENPSLLLPLSL